MLSLRNPVLLSEDTARDSCALLTGHAEYFVEYRLSDPGLEVSGNLDGDSLGVVLQTRFVEYHLDLVLVLVVHARHFIEKPRVRVRDSGDMVQD